MNVADQGSSAPSLRRPPFTIRLAPQLLNRLLQQCDKPTAADQIDGLLFGLNEDGVVIAQIHRRFEDGTQAGGSASRASQDKLLEQQLSASQKQPETSLLNLIGWYAVRTSGGLTESDLTYHNWYFPRPHDLALILRPEGESSVSLEIYCRTTGGLLSEEGHRVGLVRLSTSPLESAVEVVPRPRIQDDFFMRAYDLSDADEEKPPGSKGSFAVRYRKAFSFLRPSDDEAQPPEQKRQQAKDLPKTTVPPSASLPASASLNRPATAPEISVQTTAVGNPFNSPASASALIDSAMLASAPRKDLTIPGAVGQRRPPYVPALLLFAVVSALTFAALYYFQSSQKQAALLQSLAPQAIASQPIAPQTTLGLRVQAQNDRLLVSWDRQDSLVRNARNGSLLIEDGQQRRQLSLDASQVMGGSVLYHPSSGDVSFRLEVHGNNGLQATEMMRVLEAGKPEALNLPPPLPDASIRLSQSRLATRPNAYTPTPDLPSLRTKPQSFGTGSDDVKTEPVAMPPASEAKRPDEVTARAIEDKAAPAREERPPTVLEQPAERQLANRQQSLPKPPEPLRLPVPLPSEQPRVPSPKQNLPSNLVSYQPPKPSRQVLPNISSLPPGVIAQAGRLEVLVKVDQTGKVTDAQAVADGRRLSQMLIGSAIAAARQWKFEPAMLRGKTVSSQHSIVFQFSGRQ